MYSEDVKKFLRRVEVKAFFHNKEDDVNKPNKDTSETLQIRKPSWTSLEGQFAYFSLFIKECRQNMFKLKFNCNTKFWNLSPEEWSALKILKETQRQYYSPAVIDQKNTELFKLMIKAWNFATTLMTLRLTFSDLGPIQIINFWNFANMEARLRMKKSS